MWFIDLSRRKVKNEEKTVENEAKHMKYNWKYLKKTRFIILKIIN